MILVMGTVEQRKAQARIAQAFARIADDLPEWELVFVGDTNGRTYSQALRRYIRGDGTGRTAAGSPRSTVTPIAGIARPTYSLSASDVESLPRSMLEAMCFGVTVVSASVFGIPELMRDGETGFLFEPNGPRCLGRCPPSRACPRCLRAGASG